MGKPNIRLNPTVKSRCERILLSSSAHLLLKFALLLPEREHKKRGQRPYDYKIVLVLCILRILLCKTYESYEIEMRNDPRLCKIFGLKLLPSRSTIQRGMEMFSMDLLRKFNYLLVQDHIRENVNLLLDASGIRIIGRSIWYSIRAKKRISRRECDKIHLAVCNDQLLIYNWFITKGRRNDCPFFTRLLDIFKTLGLIIADPAYLSRRNVQYVVDKKGSPFIWIKKNITLRAKNSFAWKSMIRLFRTFPSLFKGIYNQRSKVECIFSALKRRYGDHLYSKKWYMRRREMAMRFIAYNVRLVIYITYARKHNLNCWVRA